MVSVKFKGVAPGSCYWCGKDKSEVYTIEASDFVGDLCPSDLRHYLNLKLRQSAKQSSDGSAPAVRDNGSGSRSS